MVQLSDQYIAAKKISNNANKHCWNTPKYNFLRQCPRSEQFPKSFYWFGKRILIEFEEGRFPYAKVVAHNFS